jgi:hypothetical protein
MAILEVLVVAGGAFVLGRWVVRSLRPRREGLGEKRPPEGDGAPSGRELLRAFPCQVGDVILRTAEHDEAWLAGALVFEEEAPVAALFVAPEAGGDRAVFVRAAASSGMVWLAPMPPSATPRSPEPPHTMEIGGVRFERVRRLPVHVRRVGSGTPQVGAKAILVEYAGGACDRVVVVAAPEQALCWKGVTLAEGEYEILPGKGSSDQGS